MKLKFTVCLLLLFVSSFISKAQNGIYAEYKLSQDNIVGAMLPNLITKIYATEFTIHSISSSKLISECHYLMDSAGLSIRGGRSGKCMNDTWENVDAASKEYGIMKFSNISLVKVTGDTTLLGHPCKKAIMRYTVTNTTSKFMQSSQNVTSTVWYTLDFKNYAFKGLLDPTSEDSKEYNAALSDLGGAIMYIESQTEMMMGIKMKSGTICTKIETQDIANDQQKLELKSCPSVMTAKEYAKYMRKQAQRSMNNGY